MTFVVGYVTEHRQALNLLGNRTLSGQPTRARDGGGGERLGNGECNVIVAYGRDTLEDNGE